MKRTINNLTLFLFLTTALTWIYCGDENNPLNLADPSTLVGKYKLVQFTDKTENITVKAGEATRVELSGQTVTLTITGTLELTETRYSFTLTVAISGLPTETDSGSGTYTISGNTITTVDDDTGETDTATISVRGRRLTIEDDEVILVFEKQ